MARPLSGGVRPYLAERDFAVLTARDPEGTLWATVLTGARGFLDVRDAATLRVGALPAPGAPLFRPAPGAQAGLLVIDFATGDTLRLSGTARVAWTATGTPGDDGGTGRRVLFHPDRVRRGHTPLHASPATPDRHNPPRTD
ncbi:hypothetical protein [Streptomyces sp. NPDC050560]|uniref:hypothetical protein n=1 Tax=Streptomyces sp. NPDC050560 TaxID=3365630 RepID=UPI0037B2563E